MCPPRGRGSAGEHPRLRFLHAPRATPLEDPDAWVHEAFALDGPHTPESVAAAAAAVAELVRYLHEP